jgi:hypothetical protein
MSIPGCVNGRLEDPRAFVLSLVHGRDPRDFERIMRTIESSLFAMRMGHQTDSFGVPRGRVYLPHHGAPDCSPRNDRERLLGVRQEPACWAIPVDIVNDPPTAWGWWPLHGNINGYLPPACGGSPEPTPGPGPVPEGELAKLRVELHAALARIAVLEERAVRYGSKIGLRTESGLYVCAEGGGGGEVVANREKLGAWETLIVDRP